MKESVRNINAHVNVARTRIINLEKGKLPPQAIEVEEAVLGAMLRFTPAQDEALLVLKTDEVFYRDAHKDIFNAIASLYAEARPIDMITVSARLREQNSLERAGGDVYLMELTQKIASSAHTEYHARLLLQMYIKRSIIRDASALIATAYDDDKDSLELLQEWSASLDTITENSMTGRKNMTFAEGLELVEKRVEFLTHKSPEEVTGAHTGFEVMDQFTGGYQPGELIIDAARPGMGKTAKAMKCAVTNAKAGKGVGVISGEMSTVQLVGRTVALDTDFHLKQLTKTGFEKPEYFQKLSKHKHRMKAYPIYIDDMPSPDIRHVQATARMWKRKYDIKILIVDYLQLLGDATKAGNREQEIASITRKLKALAKELDIPVIALSQLSRAVENRPLKRPVLADLRESGAIEQDADMVQFIYRPEYYGFELDMNDPVFSDGANTEIIFAKYRGGAPGTSIGLYWQGDKMKFMDVAEWHQIHEEHMARAQHQQQNDNWEQKAQERSPLPRPTPNDAFGGPGYSVTDVSNKSNPDGDVPF